MEINAKTMSDLVKVKKEYDYQHQIERILEEIQRYAGIGESSLRCIHVKLNDKTIKDLKNLGFSIRVDEADYDIVSW